MVHFLGNKLHIQSIISVGEGITDWGMSATFIPLLCGM